jgi:hypothetical protein
MSKKNKPAPQQVMPIGKNYVVKSGRSLPIISCKMNETAGLNSFVITRQIPNGNFIVGSYMVDVYCLGLKNTMYKININREEYEDFMDHLEYSLSGLEDCDYAIAHNWIYGGIAYAEDLGFKPNADFNISKYILEDDTEDIPLIEFEFGHNGKPMYVSGPFDDPSKIIATLRRNIGEGNFDFMSHAF